MIRLLNLTSNPGECRCLTLSADITTMFIELINTCNCQRNDDDCGFKEEAPITALLTQMKIQRAK